MESIIRKIKSVQETEKISELVGIVLSEDFPYKDETILAYRNNVFNQEYFKDFLNNIDNVLFGIFEKQELVGFIALKPDYGGVVFIDWLVIEKNHRGKGFGSLLLKEAEKWALENKYHYFYLFTETEENKEFYINRGFRYVGTHYKSWFGETEHIFEKVLKESPFSEVFKKK